MKYDLAERYFADPGSRLFTSMSVMASELGATTTWPSGYFTGTSDEVSLSFTKNTRNLAGLVSLAFFETTWTSSGDS
jgi:hypothetical protein